MTPLDELPRIGAPATRALAAVGITELRELDGHTRDELLALHGMGPKAMRLIEEALTEHGLGLRG